VRGIKGMKNLKVPEEEYKLKSLIRKGYKRRKCKKCGCFFWSIDEREDCGESPCASYKFLEGGMGSYTPELKVIREGFLTFFEKRGHKRIDPYPVVARWRGDLYLTDASIVCFQPYYTEGILEPQANPLTISQPSIRLVDIDRVGSTMGRHLTIFEMAAHHAFNYPGKEIYWKEEVIELCQDFHTNVLRLKDEEIIYKESWWSGGGNAGPSFEVIVGGLEVATLVFMQYKTDGELMKLPIRTVDTGYGMERYLWLLNGGSNIFEPLYGEPYRLLMRLGKWSPIDEKILREYTMKISEGVSEREAIEKISEKFSIDRNNLEKALEQRISIYRLLDHSKTLIFILSEGVVPSNVGVGYLGRLVFRKMYRAGLKLQMNVEDLIKLIDSQIDFWGESFPHLREMRDEIIELTTYEANKYEETLSRGIRRLHKILSRRTMNFESLVELYDSHGVPPDIVSEEAEKIGVKVKIPENFYSLIAEKHRGEERKKTVKKRELSITNLPETKKLYYEDPDREECSAKVLWIEDNRIVLDKTIFYPEGGGQPADIGRIIHPEGESKIFHVERVGKVIVHYFEGKRPKIGEYVRCIVDMKRRNILRRNHTATHIINGSARTVLGKHVWQAGAQKGVKESRLDITHHKMLTEEEIKEIEKRANRIVTQNIPVEIKWMPRDVAEKKYGFRLYQGGVVPGKEIRVVKIGEWEVEACGGLHVNRTGDIGLIKIVRVERIQDGVVRIIFRVGESALEYIQNILEEMKEITKMLRTNEEKMVERVKGILVKMEKLQEQIEVYKAREMKNIKRKIEENAENIGDITVYYGIVDKLEIEDCIKILEGLLNKNSKSIVIIFSISQKRTEYIIGVGSEIEADARKIGGEISKIVGGRSGGRNYFARGGLGEVLDRKLLEHEVREKVLSILRNKFISHK